MKLRLVALCLLLAISLAAQEFAVTSPELVPSTSAIAPRIAASGDRSFVTWVAGTTSLNLYGTRLDANGNVLDSPPLLLARFAGPTVAVVGTGNGDFLVVAYVHGYVVMRVSRDGTVGDTKSLFGVVPGDVIDSVALASNGASVLVALADRFALVDVDGNVIAGPTMFPSFTVTYLQPVTAASNGSGYVIAGIDGAGIAANPIDRDGKIGARTFVGTVSAISGLALASDGSRYLVASTSNVLRTQFLGNDGTPLGPWQNTTVPIDAAGTRLTWDGSGYLAAFGMSGAYGVTRIGADGMPSGAIAQVPAPKTQDYVHWFDVAGSMFVFENGRAIWRAPFGNDAFASAAPVSLAAPEQMAPSIASMPDGAVVAWAEGGTARVETVGSDGRPSGRVTTLQHPQFGTVVSTQVAFDGTNVVVVVTEASGIVSAQRFTPALDAVDSAPIALGNGPSAIAGGGGVTLLAWIAPPASSGAYVPMKGVLLRGTDAPLPLQFPVPLADPVDPAAVWNGSEFLVMWGEQRLGDTAGGVRFAANGALLDAVPLKLVVGSESTSVSRLALASNGHDVFAVWTNHDFDAPVVFEKRIGAAGAQLLFTTTTLGRPMVAALHAGFVVGSLNADDFQTRETLKWSVNGGPLQSLAFTPVSGNNALPLGAFAPSGNNVLAAYTRWDAAAGYVHRVFVRVIATEKPHAVRR